MSVIVHLSDPHFGAEEAGLVGPLVDAVKAVAPDLVVLSGDLTQRARASQFAAAAGLIAAMPAPCLTVPGNHDVPLWNLGLRLFDPWRRWRDGTGADREPIFVTDTLMVLCLNSANPLAWKSGRLGRDQLSRIEAVFAAAARRRRVLVLHHPLQGPPDEPQALRGTSDAVPVLDAAGVEVVLSGHLHATYVKPLANARRILQVQAGTCLSHRVRGDGNAFNSLRFIAGGVVVTHHRAGPDGIFRADADLVLQRGAEGWG